MKKIKLKIKSFINKGPAPHRRRKSSGAGFVILFAVTISSILVAIALGVGDIALKEVKFGTSAIDANNAFFAADTGIEYVLFHDKSSGSDFIPDPGDEHSWDRIVSGLGSAGASCAKITIHKDNTNPPITLTTVISKGYNIGDASCESSNPDRLEREVQVSY